MDGFSSPDNFIDWSWYSLISACLQRRVYVGPAHSPLFGNTYTILVADPGIGKGLCIKEVTKLLKFHKLDPEQLAKQFAKNTISDDEKTAMNYLAEEDYKSAHALTNSVKSNIGVAEKPLLFPIAADATTYEALVRAMGNNVRRMNYRENDPVTGKSKMGVYMHSSLSFALEEMSSLFRKRTEDVVNFMIKSYDCDDYTYDTKTQGKDRIRRCCLNFIAGTTPAFLQSSFDDFLLTEGFSSRTFFIYAVKNRKSSMWIPELNNEQRKCYQSLLEHVYNLAHIYGHVEVTNETMNWLEEWWRDFDSKPEKRANSSPKLIPYYSRKNIHVMKLAMAIHFGESTELRIEQHVFERAMEILEREEKTMHCALAIEKTNPLSTVTNKILKHLQINGKQTRGKLISEFWNSMISPYEDIDNVLEYLISENKIKKVEIESPITQKIEIYFQAI